MAPGVTLLLMAGDGPRGLVTEVYDAQDRAVVHLMATWVHPSVRGRARRIC
jgi:hypothetical protein